MSSTNCKSIDVNPNRYSKEAQVSRSQLQSQFPVEYINSVMERARQGQLSSRYLDPHFIVTPELADRLLELLDEVEKL